MEHVVLAPYSRFVGGRHLPRAVASFNVVARCGCRYVACRMARAVMVVGRATLSAAVGSGEVAAQLI